MSTATAESRPYHHGDLSRALVDAARKILETEGPAALSLRAVAREAGVSPAAPYHHFKDKNDLLEAVAHFLRNSGNRHSFPNAWKGWAMSATEPRHLADGI